MRLLNVRTRQLEEFVDARTPPYSILSHTWGDDEVSFQDMVAGHGRAKQGYQKILGCCAKTISEGISYTWIDTCCIDKSSSAELSEAINSMFLWYRNAEICYAYLEDINRLEDETIQELLATQPPKPISSSRWFTRGWTLQELLAPAEVIFLDAHWIEIGSKTSCANQFSEITGIPPEVLSTSDWTGCSIAQRLSWASKRQTTRIEDEAYSLLGLFGINMPLLYGEGSKAFLRLQQELLRVFDDYSIFAWTSREHECTLSTYNRGLFATSPAFFRSSGQVRVSGFGGKYPLAGPAGQKTMPAPESAISCEPKRHMVEMSLPHAGPLGASELEARVSRSAVVPVSSRLGAGFEPFKPRMCRNWLCPSDTQYALVLLNCEDSNGYRLAVLLIQHPAKPYFERAHCPSIVHLKQGHNSSDFAVQKLFVASGTEYVSRPPHTAVSSKNIVVRFAGVQEFGYTKVTPDGVTLWSYDGKASNSHHAEGVPESLVIRQGDGRRLLPSIRIRWHKDEGNSDFLHKTYAMCESLPRLYPQSQQQSGWRCITRGSHTMIERLSETLYAVMTVRQSPRSILHTIRIVERRRSGIPSLRERPRSPSPTPSDTSDTSGFTSDEDQSWDEMEEDGETV